MSETRQDTLRELVAKWRKESDALTIAGSPGDAVLAYCADELESVLAQMDAPAPAADFSEYLKDGETLAEAFERNRDDVFAVVELLRQEKEIVSAALRKLNAPCQNANAIWNNYAEARDILRRAAPAEAPAPPDDEDFGTIEIADDDRRLFNLPPVPSPSSRETLSEERVKELIDLSEYSAEQQRILHRNNTNGVEVEECGACTVKVMWQRKVDQADAFRELLTLRQKSADDEQAYDILSRNAARAIERENATYAELLALRLSHDEAVRLLKVVTDIYDKLDNDMSEGEAMGAKCTYETIGMRVLKPLADQARAFLATRDKQ